MNQLYQLLLCFGERFINNTKEEMLFDIEYNRDNLVGAYNAILDYVRLLDAE